VIWLKYTEGIRGAEVKTNGLERQRRLLLSGNTSEVLKNKPIRTIKRRGNSLSCSHNDILRSETSQAPVAHTCNPRNSGGKRSGGLHLKPAGGNG
jgi:hypothetical protein